jgi:signal transduction histidine kinase
VDELVKVLLVDDEERNLDALETVLASSGCTFVRARSADEALLAVLQTEFAAIILDIKMPGTSGLEAAQLIKRRKKTEHVPILFLTAHMLDEKDALEAYGVGGADFLTKPINPDILRSKVAVFVDLFRKTRALADAVDALQVQITEREHVQRQLQLAKDELESRVRARTAELDQANEALREADRRKDEFLATLAHELRNPIAPVRYAAQVMNLKGPHTDELRWAVDVIQRQTHHMARLIDDLLDVSRISRNTLELRRERTDFGEILERAVEASKPLIESNGIQLIVHNCTKSVWVDADPIRLAQVFSNLLNNAAKYGKTSESAGRIVLTVESPGNTVVVRVKDMGIGIASHQLPRVFDMFTQVGRSIDQSEGGLGIGLALARRLVEMHGGTISARSEGVGKGSEFIVTLPRVASEDRPNRPEQQPADRPLKRRILIADDNPDVVEAFEIMLETLGHEVQTAHDGFEVLEKAEQFRPEIAVLDIGMPKLNGYDAARQLRQRPWSSDLILVAVTGWGSDKDKRESQEAGFDVHWVKPIDPVEFGEWVGGQAKRKNGKIRRD